MERSTAFVMVLPQPPVDDDRDGIVELGRVTPRPVVRDLTVIVPTVGRAVLGQALTSIARGSRWPARVVIVDQSDADLVVRLVELLSSSGMNVERITAPRLGVAAARNRGIEQVRTGWFVISDDDHRVTEDWLEHMHHHLGRHRSAVVTGMVAPASPGVPSSTTDEVSAVHTRPLLTRDPLFAGNMGTSMGVVSRVGPFDESEALEGAEDNEWGYRAIRLGVPIVYEPDAKVIHLDWRDTQGIEATYRRYARAQGAFYGKHLRRGDPFIALRAGRDVLRGPWMLARGFASRNAELTMLGRAETAGILPGIVEGLRIRGPARRHEPAGS